MNLPNKLSLARICMIPLFVAVYFLPFWWAPVAAVAIFILAAFTDFLDGHIARKYNLVTDLGKLLDPIADKILVTAALFCVVATNPFGYRGQNPALSIIADMTAWQNFTMIFLTVAGIVILARELLISAMRQIAASKGVVVQANIFGKIKTVCQDITLPVVCFLYIQKYIGDTEIVGDTVGHLMPEQYFMFFEVLNILGIVMLSLTTLITVLSGVVYLVQNRAVFAENKPESKTEK